MSASLVILFVIWIVMGAGIGFYADSIFKGDRPYGANGDVVAGLATAIIVGVLDWVVIPLVFPNMGQSLIFVAAILEPLLSIFIVLWLLRYIKNR